MRLTRQALTAGSLALAAALAAPAGLAQWGPWGRPAWGPYAPPVVTYEDVDTFYGPLGPSWADIRRIERRSAWRGLGVPADVPSPLGPSPTEIRRFERQMFLRGLGYPY